MSPGVPCLFLLALGERHERLVFRSDVISRGTDNFVVDTLFDDMSRPACGTCNHEQWREHGGRNTHHVIRHGREPIEIREHLLDARPLSEVCEKYGIAPTQFYQWQKTLFEQGAAAFEPKKDSGNYELQDKVQQLNKKLVKKYESAFPYFTEIFKRGLADGINLINNKKSYNDDVIKMISIDRANEGKGLHNV